MAKSAEHLCSTMTPNPRECNATYTLSSTPAYHNPQNAHYVLITDLNDCRSGSHCIVRHRRIATCQHHIGLTANRRGALVCRGYNDGEASVDWGGLGEDWAGNGDEGGEDLGLAVCWFDCVVRGKERYRRASHYLLRVGGCCYKCGECLCECQLRTNKH